MRIVFMGSDEIAVPSLQKIVEDPELDLVLVVTQPDRPSGRKMKITPCAVKEQALKLGLPVHDPEKIGSPESVEVLTNAAPDLQMVAAYGQYIPESVLALPPRGSINLHPSLLPRYRGASPIQAAIADGLTQTGITILYVTREMDAGDIILQEDAPIYPDDTAQTVKERLAVQGGELFLKAAQLIRENKATRTPQDESQLVYVSKLSREDARMDWDQPAAVLHNRVRAYQPWPGAYCLLPDSDTRLKVYKTEVDESGSGSPGEIISLDEKICAATGSGGLMLLQVQPRGKKPMAAKDFLRGYSLQIGDRLG